MAIPTMDATTTNTQIVVDWSALTTAESGYSDAISYNLYWDSGSDGLSYTSLVGELSLSTSVTYTISTGITEGEDYKFKVRAQNIHGWGSFSDPLTVTAATTPDTPSAPATSLDSDGNVVVTWTAPSANGADISAYSITFSDPSEATYNADAECDGTDSGIVTSLTCTVLMNTLTTAPHGLALSELIKVKVAAQNSRGWGSTSASNTSGETAKTVPQIMADVTRGSDTKTSQIQVDWVALTTTSATGDSSITSYEL